MPDIENEVSVNSTANNQENLEIELRRHYDAVAASLASVASGLYHSHRQGVMLCDYPAIGVYDNNGGLLTRESFWAALKDALPAHGFVITGEGSYDEDDEHPTPGSRALVVEWRPKKASGFVSQAAQVAAARKVRQLVVRLKTEYRVHDAHDVVLLVPQDSRQDLMDAAVLEATK